MPIPDELRAKFDELQTAMERKQALINEMHNRFEKEQDAFLTCAVLKSCQEENICLDEKTIAALAIQLAEEFVPSPEVDAYFQKSDRGTPKLEEDIALRWAWHFITQHYGIAFRAIPGYAGIRLQPMCTKAYNLLMDDMSEDDGSWFQGRNSKRAIYGKLKAKKQLISCIEKWAERHDVDTNHPAVLMPEQLHNICENKGCSGTCVRSYICCHDGLLCEACFRKLHPLYDLYTSFIVGFYD